MSPARGGQFRWRNAAVERVEEVLTQKVRGPADETPDYTATDSAPFNKAVMRLFRKKMASLSPPLAPLLLELADSPRC